MSAMQTGFEAKSSEERLVHVNIITCGMRRRRNSAGLRIGRRALEIGESRCPEAEHPVKLVAPATSSRMARPVAPSSSA